MNPAPIYEIPEIIGGPLDGYRGPFFLVKRDQNRVTIKEGYYSRVPRQHRNSPVRFAWCKVDKKYVL